jgi:hypothetical protein
VGCETWADLVRGDAGAVVGVDAQGGRGGGADAGERQTHGRRADTRGNDASTFCLRLSPATKRTPICKTEL